jgi:Na+:H+ antiporter, NhaA family
MNTEAHSPLSRSETLDVIGTPRFLRPLEKFLHIEAASGLVLLVAVVVALVWANWPGSHSYHDVWHAPLGFHFGGWHLSLPVHFYINDVLMTVFFLVVGLEIRREIHEGALASMKLAALPLAAAVGGIVLPAGIYALLNTDPALRQGWAVPTATDIAFAVGLLALLGKRVPAQLRILLLAIAIIDDIGAILVIAFFYSSGIMISGLLIAVGGVLLVRVYHYLGVRTALPYLLPGAIVWFGILSAGVHPTIAGVALGLLTPVQSPVDRQTLLANVLQLARRLRDRFTAPTPDVHQIADRLQQLKIMQREMLPPVVRVQAALHPWVAFGIMPLFALANAGVLFDRTALQSLTTSTLSIGIVLGLVLGKPIGILLTSALVTRLKIAALPEGVNYRGVLVIGCLAGIGFTMSIFISQLAFGDELLLDTAKLAVLLASTIAALFGLALGRQLLRVP